MNVLDRRATTPFYFASLLSRTAFSDASVNQPSTSAMDVPASEQPQAEPSRSRQPSGPTTSVATYVVFICTAAALGGLLFGYDTAVISGAVGFLQAHFELSAAGIGWATSSGVLGSVLGVSISGVLSDGIGRKKTLLLSALLFLISAIGTALAEVFAMFVAFRLLGGMGVGIASMTAPMYIAEVSPAHVRGSMVSIYQLAIVIGIQVVYFANYFIAGHGTEAWNEAVGWRWMFGSEALPALLFLGALFFVPETPRWLVGAGRRGDARDILDRLIGKGRASARMDEIETAIVQESGSVRQLFQPGLRILLVVGVALAVFAQASGINAVIYYAPEIFRKMGASTDVAFLRTVTVGTVNFLFTFVAIIYVDRFGRRPLLITGAAGMFIAHMVLGGAFFFEIVGGWTLVFILGFVGCFAFSLGPVTWVVLSEIYPNRVRGRAMSIATVCLWITNFVVSQTFPMMTQSDALNRLFNGAFPFWLFAAFCALATGFVWRFVPETKGKSLEEIEEMWGLNLALNGEEIPP